jgi:hypothetical protein
MFAIRGNVASWSWTSVDNAESFPVQVIHAFLFMFQDNRVSVSVIPTVEQASVDITDFVVKQYVFRANGPWFLVQQVPGSQRMTLHEEKQCDMPLTDEIQCCDCSVRPQVYAMLYHRCHTTTSP